METGELKIDEKKELSIPQKATVEAIDEVREGKFIPDRENDELTKALGNSEKPGGTRGFGPTVPWKAGFPEDCESYRSRARAKKRKEQDEADRLQAVERRHEELYAMFKR